MSRVCALNWRSFILVVCVAALPRIDAITCRRCVGTFFNDNWDHFVFNGSKPPMTTNCHLKLDTQALDKLPPNQKCESAVCIDYYVYNALSTPDDPSLYSHVRDCAKDLLGKPVPTPADPLLNSYCDYDSQAWCSGGVTQSPFNIVCGNALVTYSSLCTTVTDKEPACNNDYNWYKSCRQDQKTNPCMFCNPSVNATACENEGVVYGKWCTTTTISDSKTGKITVQRGVSATNPYSNKGNLTRTIGDQTYTIEYCSTTYCNGLTPWTGTSTTTTAAPPSTGPTQPSTAPPPTAPPSPSSSPAPPQPTSTPKLASSIVASALTVGVCIMLLTLFGL